MELIARGWRLATAAREVGISRSAAYLWRDRAIVRAKNGTMRIVAPPEPAALRPISPRFLSEDERIRIADLASEGHGPKLIGHRLSRSASTVSRELRRNRHVSGQYRPFHAHRQGALRRYRLKPLRLSTPPALMKYVSERLATKWSPGQIS
jgi:IS30 family transposase